jgi:hypothetical protein
MNAPGPALAPDAAMVLGIAATAMPFARTPEAEAERWLRILRLHGEVGSALQALGVSEGPLQAVAREEGEKEEKAAGEQKAEEESEEAAGEEADRERRVAAPRADEDDDDRDAVARVTENALHIAGRRGAAGVSTADLLMAVMHVYGDDFDRVLWAHGTDRDEVIERLGVPVLERDGG